MANLLDLMNDVDRSRMLDAYKKRVEKGKDAKVPPETYLMCEFATYFGWDGLQAIRNNDITLEEVYVLLEGMRKVRSKRLAELATIGVFSVSTPLSKHPRSGYREGIKKIQGE